MRRLIYVPIIHTGPDLGTLAAGIEGQASTVVSSHTWQKHKEVVNLYWQVIASYWKSAHAAGFKIFQDGMPVDGITGKNIVKDLAAQGSINHQIIEQLLEQGAELVQTESPTLLKQEYLLTGALLKKKSPGGSLLALFRYKWHKGRLLKARDAYIIKSINAKLRDGETGICFLGASHQILTGIARDIEVITLKDPAKVRAYSQKFSSKKGEVEVNRLGSYLTTPIETTQGETHE